MKLKLIKHRAWSQWMTRCGRLHGGTLDTSYDWRRVTCKQCLKHRFYKSSPSHEKKEP